MTDEQVREIEELTRKEFLQAIIKAMKLAQVHRNKSRSERWRVIYVHKLQNITDQELAEKMLMMAIFEGA